MKRCDAMAKVMAEKDAQKARERRCFWTWPWGHCPHWRDRGRTYYGMPVMTAVCCHCGAETSQTPPAGEQLVKEAPGVQS